MEYDEIQKLGLAMGDKINITLGSRSFGGRDSIVLDAEFCGADERYLQYADNGRKRGAELIGIKGLVKRV